MQPNADFGTESVSINHSQLLATEHLFDMFPDLVEELLCDGNVVDVLYLTHANSNVNMVLFCSSCESQAPNLQGHD